MELTSDIGAASLSELVKKVQSGNEVLITQNNKLVARMVRAGEPRAESVPPFTVRSFKGHKVLTPIISQSELAEEMFRSP